MKILQIRFKNLNSLVGEWLIDLSHPEYQSEGIFAITGPTGSGKSTIFDAVCLALYGCTPRLKSVSASTNEIMSRQTGDCFAEVTFETHGGRFRCQWSQHRARLRVEGPLQQPKHELSDAISGTVLSSSIKDIARRIEEISGMDFDRFTRSMLLAQGAFDKFLKAGSAERAAILEQITGSAIYGQISMRVHERHREEKEKLERLQSEVNGIALLTHEQEGEVGERLEQMQKQDAVLESRVELGRVATSWLMQMDRLRREIGDFKSESENLQKRFESFGPEREKMERAEKAAALEGAYATLIATRNQQSSDHQLLKAAESSLPSQESASMEAAAHLAVAEQKSTALKTRQADMAPLLRQVRSHDQNLAVLRKRIVEGDSLCKRDALAIEANRKAAMEIQSKRSKAEGSLGQVAQYLQEHASDAALVGGFGGIEAQLGILQAHSKEIVGKQSDLEQASKEADHAGRRVLQCGTLVNSRKQELEHATEKVLKGREQLLQLLGGRLLREYGMEKDHLQREKELRAVIASLEDHRKTLVEGKPCPLCGATEHPYAEGHVPEPGELEQRIEALSRIIENAANQEQEIRVLEQKEIKAREGLSAAENQKALAEEQAKHSAGRVTTLQEALKQLHLGSEEQQNRVLRLLLPLGISKIEPHALAPLLEGLRERLRRWQAKQEEKLALESLITSSASEINRLNAVLEQQSTALAEKRADLANLRAEFESTGEQRRRLFEDRNPDEEEQSLQQAVLVAEAEEKSARMRRDEVYQRCTTLKERIETLQNGIGQRAQVLANLEERFAIDLPTSGFPGGEASWLACRLSVDERRSLATRAKQLDDTRTSLHTQLQDRELRLQEELDKRITEQSLEALAAQLREDGDLLKALRDEITTLRMKLQSNAEAKERQKEKLEEVAAQGRVWSPWRVLHDLIGSADGKKFREYAQGLTFEVMIRHANQQLQKMSDRYLLLRNNRNEPLELHVCDSYQAGEIRTTQNLSGGEGFIVSLALALGLSKMASKQVRVDSLFLDEGFGTLDEEALDTAISTLAGMQQEGKLIGVISHVEALKLRLRAQIQVERMSGGRSRITGPGCSRVVKSVNVTVSQANEKKARKKPAAS